jgi:N-sulfoglucosamine sulfohydrolase
MIRKTISFGAALIVTAIPVVAKQQRPNVLFILSDDHSMPYLGCYGNTDLKTPNIDKLANEGILFNKAYVAAPQSVPSRASLMTGRSVVDVNMLRFTAPLDREVITYPELMRKQGYYTGICGRYYHLDGNGSTPSEYKEFIDKNKLKTFPERYDYVKIGNDDQTITQFEEFLKSPHGDKPFYMWAGFHDPHRPFNAPDFEPDPEKLTIPAGMPDTKLLRKDLAAHYGLIQRLDFHVGKLLEVLTTKGLMDNTIIIFMGDNGASLLRGKGTLYECGIHVPLIVWYPKMLKSGMKSDVLVSGEDIGPTVLDLLQINPDPKMTGRSFVSVLKGSAKEFREYAFAVRGTHAYMSPGTSDAFDLSRTVFNKKYKLIYNPMFNLPYCPVDFGNQLFWKELVELNKANQLPEKFSSTYIFSKERPLYELYDLENDPNEMQNLSGKLEYASIEKTLKTEMMKWMILNKDVVPLPILETGNNQPAAH